MNKYDTCVIKNLRKSKLTGNIHADVIAEDGTLLISATLDYCSKVIHERAFNSKFDETENND